MWQLLDNYRFLKRDFNLLKNCFVFPIKDESKFLRQSLKLLKRISKLIENRFWRKKRKFFYTANTWKFHRVCVSVLQFNSIPVSALPFCENELFDWSKYNWSGSLFLCLEMALNCECLSFTNYRIAFFLISCHFPYSLNLKVYF